MLSGFSCEHGMADTCSTSSSFFILHLYCILLLLPAQDDVVSLAEMEDSLLRNLFRGYQKWVRPVLHSNDTITVCFGLKISQLVDVVRRQHRMLFLGEHSASSCSVYLHEYQVFGIQPTEISVSILLPSLRPVCAVEVPLI